MRLKRFSLLGLLLFAGCERPSEEAAAPGRELELIDTSSENRIQAKVYRVELDSGISREAEAE